MGVGPALEAMLTTGAIVLQVLKQPSTNVARRKKIVLLTLEAVIFESFGSQSQSPGRPWD